LSGNQEPHERQPQLPRIGERAIVNQHLGRIRRSDDLEQIAETGGVNRPEPRSMTEGGPGAHFTVFGRGARNLQSSSELRNLEHRKYDGDGKRTRFDAKQGFLQVRIECGEFSVGWLFGKIGVRPKALAGAILWWIGSRLFLRKTHRTRPLFDN